MKPSIGRIVHYFHSLEPGWPLQPFAAIVTAVSDADPTLVWLTVFVPDGPAFVHHGGSHYSAEMKKGCWTWPPRV